MRTNQSYINEYSFFDAIYEYLESYSDDIAVCMYNYDKNLRNIDMRATFESVAGIDVLMENEGEGVLTKIGNKVLHLIHLITDCIKKITEKVLGTTKVIKSDEEHVSEILREHPELKTMVCKGLEQEWFTYKDVAAYKKDIAGLITMLKKNAIDHQTFKDKVAEASKKFVESAKPIIDVGCTVTSLVGILPSIGKKCNETKDFLSSFREMCDDCVDNTRTNYSKNGVTRVEAIANALGQAVGLVTKECNARAVGHGKISSWLHTFANNKPDSIIGKLVNTHDNRVSAAKAKAGSRYYNRVRDQDTKIVRNEIRKQDQLDRVNRRLRSAGHDEIKEIKIDKKKS